jgi:hypothetical protein
MRAKRFRANRNHGANRIWGETTRILIKKVKVDFIYYYIIAIKWGESTHFPWRNDPVPIILGGCKNNVINLNTKEILKMYIFIL